MTLVTDWVLAGVAALLARRLFAEARHRASLSLAAWGGAFGASSLGALLGGAYHGFAPQLAESSQTVLWKATVFSVGFMSFFLLAAVVLAQLPSRFRRWLVVALGVKLVVYLAWMASHDEFKYVIWDYGSAMVAALAVQAARLRDAGPRWIAGGILVSFAAAGVQLSGFALHRHFNHNDLYHVIQMAGLWMLYRGAMRLQA
jgi:hypothetical protein